MMQNGGVRVATNNEIYQTLEACEQGRAALLYQLEMTAPEDSGVWSKCTEIGEEDFKPMGTSI